MLFIFLFVGLVCSAGNVLVTTGVNGTLMVISGETGNSIKKGSEHIGYMSHAVKDNADGCEYLVGGISDIYHYDCSSLKMGKKYPFYNAGTIQDLFYDNTANILYGIMMVPVSPVIRGLSLVQFNPPTFFRRHYTTKEIVSFDHINNLNFVSACYDEKNKRVVMLSFDVEGYLHFYDMKTKQLKVAKSGENIQIDTISCLPSGNHTEMYTSENGYVFKLDVTTMEKKPVAEIGGNSYIYPGIVSQDGRNYVGYMYDYKEGENWYSCDLGNVSDTCNRVGSVDVTLDHKFVWSKKHF